MSKRGAIAVTALAVLVPAARASAAELYVWGNNAATPQAVSLPEPVAQLDASNVADFVLTTGGQVYRVKPHKGKGKATAKNVGLPEPMVTTGEARDSGMAINAKDEGWVWGENGSHHLCTTANTQTPVHPSELTEVTAVQGGETHTMWLKQNGTVESCGSNESGAMGVGESVRESSTPIVITGLENVVEMSAGEHQELARTASGEVYGWGGNNWGQTCTGSEEAKIFTPQRVQLPEPAKQISAGGNFSTDGSSLIVLQDGELYGCGDNKQGQAAPNSAAEKLISPTATGLKFTQAVTAGQTSFGITEAGELVAWGGTEYGLAGERSGEVRTPVLMLEGVKSVSATAKTAEALK
jgi:alpha-tubulin suppressor-like RCC1 family protein